MTKVFEILKSVNIKILFLMTLVMAISIPSLARADDLPRCSEIPAGSAECVCDTLLFGLINTTVCKQGQACEKTRTINTDGTVTNAIRCISVKQAENSPEQIALQVTNISSSDSYNFTKTPPVCEAKETKCAPKCYYDKMENKCSFCPLFAVFFRASSVMTRKAIDGYSGSVTKVVIMGFAVWIALQILAFVSTLETRDFKDLVLAIVTQSFFVIIAVGLLESGAFSFLNEGLRPIYSTGTNAAKAILTPGQLGSGENALIKEAQQKNAEQKQNTEQTAKPESYSCQSMDQYNLPNEAKEGALPNEMAEGVLCTMGLIQNRAARVKALGSASICYSWERKAFIIPHLGYLLVGIGLWVGGMLIILAVPFMMIDSVLQLAVAGSLLPFAIGAYAFKSTRQYTGKVWETFMNSMFAFVFVSLIALMLTAAYEQIIVGAIGSLDTMFASYTNNNEMSKILADLSWFSPKFLEVCFVLILSWAVMGEATDFAKQFSGSISSTKIGSQIGTMGGSFAKSAATKILEPTAKAAAGKAWDLTKGGMAGVAHIARKAKINTQASNIKKKGSYDAATGTYTMQTKSWLLGRSKTLTLKEDASGQKNVTESKVRSSRTWYGKKSGTAIRTKVKNQNFTVNTTTYTRKDGSVYHNEQVTINSNFLDNLIDKNGTLNQENINKVMDSIKGNPDQEKLMIALQKQIISKTMPNTKMNIKDHQYLEQKAVYDEKGNMIGFEETHPDGSKTFVKMDINAGIKDGRMMVDLTQIDADGRGTSLSTDGVINRKSTFQRPANWPEATFENWNKPVGDHFLLQKTTYGYSKHYDYYHKTKRYSKLNDGLRGSLFSESDIKSAQDFTAVKGNEMATAHMYEFDRYYQ